MSDLICVGMLDSAVYSKMHENSRRVYSENGMPPTLHTSGGGNTEIKVLIHENEQADGTDNDITR